MTTASDRKYAEICVDIHIKNAQSFLDIVENPNQALCLRVERLASLVNELVAVEREMKKLEES